MPDAVSALSGALSAGAVAVHDTGLRGMVTLRADLSATATGKAVKAVTGLRVPGQRAAVLQEGRGVLWMSPDEVMLLVPYEAAAGAVAGLSAALAGTHHLAVDVSDARAIIAIEGPGCREVLAKGAPVDLASSAFGPGMIRRTRLGTLAVAFWMTGPDAFEVMCFRSVAQYVFDWLETAARPGSLPGVIR
jgi:sarcosine oxidase subunit gamma